VTAPASDAIRDRLRAALEGLAESHRLRPDQVDAAMRSVLPALADVLPLLDVRFTAQERDLLARAEELLRNAMAGDLFERATVAERIDRMLGGATREAILSSIRQRGSRVVVQDPMHIVPESAPVDGYECLACATGDCSHETQRECNAWLAGYRTGLMPAGERPTDGDGTPGQRFAREEREAISAGRAALQAAAVHMATLSETAASVQNAHAAALDRMLGPAEAEGAPVDARTYVIAALRRLEADLRRIADAYEPTPADADTPEGAQKRSVEIGYRLALDDVTWLRERAEAHVPTWGFPERQLPGDVPA
jgi:hypothetical protein